MGMSMIMNYPLFHSCQLSVEGAGRITYRGTPPGPSTWIPPCQYRFVVESEYSHNPQEAVTPRRCSPRPVLEGKALTCAERVHGQTHPAMPVLRSATTPAMPVLRSATTPAMPVLRSATVRPLVVLRPVR
eukprot:gene13808-biopygen9557